MPRTRIPKCSLASSFVLALLVAGSTPGADFLVTSDGDEGDGNPGNGFCATPGMLAACTLRAAVEESNALAGADRIFIGAGTIQLSWVLELTDEVSIQGAGAANTTIRGPFYSGTNAIYVNATTATIEDLALVDTEEPFVEGAIYNTGDLTIRRVWFSGNRAENCGAVFSEENLTILDSTFSNNRGGGFGGALCAVYSGQATISNTTFVGNSAPRGAAIVVGQPADITFSTIVDNVHTSASQPSDAIWVVGGGLHLDKTLIWGHCDRGVYSVTSNGGGLEGPGDTCMPQGTGNTSNVTRQQMHLGSFGDYGGPVPTVLPGTQSMAVDPPPDLISCPTFDARGVLRDSLCDVGAAERQPADPESGPFFADGYESGSTQAWSLTTPD